ncbi:MULTISPECIES: choline dehydrogenase [Halomonadaceae]|uniref:Choline dehydrogenase n=1 Tax=Vreelandella halophila TaxID=86177 RepID=A0A9X4YD59_9GAMM|nr:MULTISPECIES: choline dehydrogenase [Halomonas]MYL27093.1 choline dehydrogenase [Halomonas utahensis]MYL74295.1 choline dehydrogenase [Halomonas sp. 22501_18_FS]
MSKHQYDTIIVGAGSAGCVLANRLTEDPHHRVLLLETGGSDRSIFIQMPTALSIPMNTKKFAWQFHTEPEPYLDNRRMHCPRGKVLGGSSSINGMVYVRGHAKDFDEWEAHGAEGWNYQNCLPYFKKAETWVFGGDMYRGDAGPVGTSNGNNMKNPLYQAFIDAGEQAGYPVTRDYNGHQQEGFGPMHMTVKNGVRSSTSNAYLRPVMKRPNLTVLTGALVHKVLLKGKQAVGVRYERGGKVQDVKANSEVILSAGSIGSPHILQLSGIGNPDVLNKAGIEVNHALPGVGSNLQDHLEFYFQFRCKQPTSLNSKLNPLSKALIGARWILNKDGLGATNHFESCAFIRSKAGVEWPDLQYHFLPAAMRYDGKEAFAGHGFQVHVGHNKPKSRGHVHVRSADPKAAPEILFNYLQHEDDREGFRDCVRLTREIINQPAMDDYRDEEIQPGTDVTSDEAIDAFVRQAVESAYHPSCTCPMGTDAQTVVDPETRVHGISGLRVVDSSVFPTIPNGNLNGPTIMVAERAADLIRGRQPEAPLDAPVGMDEHWRVRQRAGEPERVLR